MGSYAGQSLLEASKVVASLKQLAGAAQSDVKKHVTVYEPRKH